MRQILIVSLLGMAMVVSAAVNSLTTTALPPLAPPNTSAEPSAEPNRVVIHNDVVYDRQGKVIAANTVDAVNQDSLYFKNYYNTYLMMNPKVQDPSPVNRTPMSWQYVNSFPAMDVQGNYVYEAYLATLRKYSTVDGSYTSQTLSYPAGTGTCGVDANYLYVLGSTNQIYKYTLDGTYVNTTTIDQTPYYYSMSLVNDTIWIANNHTVTCYGYAASRFNGGSISYDAVWTFSMGTGEPTTFGFDGTYYYFIFGGYSSNSFYRFYRNRTLYSTGTINIDPRCVQCLCPRGDVGVSAIKAPTGVIDSGTVTTPACSVYNYGGTTVDRYRVRMRIGSTYNDTAPVTAHASGTYKYVAFPTSVVWARGTQAITCSTELQGDVAPANDKRTGSVNVQVRDVGTSVIKAPTGLIDSGTVTTPACSVYNYGTTTESYNVTMKIGAGYTAAASVTSHGPGTAVGLTFTTWPALPRGNLAVSCSTELATDANKPNDKMSGAVFVRVFDVGATGIVAPTAGVDSGVPVTPQATIHNFGNVAATFDIKFSTDDGYASTINKTVEPGADSTFAFASWTPVLRGNRALKCSTALTTDVDATNDKATASVTVNVHDVGVAAIVDPAAQIQPGAMTPRARLHNWGTVREAMTATFMINAMTPYAATVNLPDGLPVANDTVVEFPSWDATEGYFTAKCSTYLANDQVEPNNVLSKSFRVTSLVMDVAATGIIGPAGPLDSSVVVIPSAKVKNLGEAAASFTTYFRIDSSGTTIYQNSIAIHDLPVSHESTLVFTEWPKPHAIGSYTTKCTTALAGDNVPANNAQSGSFTITAAPPPPSETGWVRKADLPLGPKSKKVKDGGCLAYSSDSSYSSNSIYAFKGNNRCEFYQYNTASNTWDTKESIPAVGASGRKKAVKKGAAITADEAQIYAAKGNNCLEFWSYDPSYQSYSSYPWTQKADVPPGAKNVKEGAGAAAVIANETTYVYFLKGSGTQEFYRYNPMPNLWETMTPAPLGASNKTWKNGSCIAYDGANTIYAVKGSYNEFFSYSCSTNAWTSLTTLPLIGSMGKKKKVKDGAGLAYHAGHLYAQKGGNTYEFWTYAADSDRWTQGPDVPLGTGKKVKGGGALVYASGPNALYEFKGNNTLDFFKYGFSAISSQLAAYRPNEMSNLRLETSDLRLAARPNPFTNTTTISYTLPRPGNVSLKLYDVTGKLVNTLASGYRNAGTSSLIVPRSSLSSGIYLLKLVTENTIITSKLIIE